jgi:hypothetical protein
MSVRNLGGLTSEASSVGAAAEIVIGGVSGGVRTAAEDWWDNADGFCKGDSGRVISKRCKIMRSVICEGNFEIFNLSRCFATGK